MEPDRSHEDHSEPAGGLPKQEARRRGLAARDALTPTERARFSAAVCARALELPELTSASSVMLFASFRSEIDTGPLVAEVLGSGKSVCLPRILRPRVMAAYRVRDLEADLAPGTWGIPEPREGLPEVPPEAVDLVFVPGSAFDEEGRRCGYGGGFYDTFLQRARHGTPRVALAFEAQLVPRIDTEEHDLPVTAVVTERRVIRPS